MKNLKKFTISRAGIVSIVSIGVVLFSISTIETGKKTVPFQVTESTLMLSGASGQDKWSLQANSIASTGDFQTQENELLDISNLSFKLAVKQLKSTNHQQESILQDLFSKNGCSELTFKQSHVMILPILKRAHVIGNFSMLNGGYNIPLQLHYELNEGRSLRIWGKQVVSLSEFGIKIPSYENGRIDDEIELAIDFTLVNKSEERPYLMVKN